MGGDPGPLTIKEDRGLRGAALRGGLAPGRACGMPRARRRPYLPLVLGLGTRTDMHSGGGQQFADRGGTQHKQAGPAPPGKPVFGDEVT